MLGADPARAGRDWRNRVGLVLQESELNPVYTVRETVAMFATVLQAVDRSRRDNCLCRAGG